MRSVAAIAGATVVLTIAAAAGAMGTLGWAVGVVAALVMNLALAIALERAGEGALTPADWVTLSRATLVVVVTALVADGFLHAVATPLLVTLAAVALALDAVDGNVARRTHQVTSLGARFDMEVDAWLILVLSIHALHYVGPWVLAIGLARYALLAAGWMWPWLKAETRPRYWNKVVAAVQGITLTVAAADVLPRPVMAACLLVALALLAESFADQVFKLWRQRPGGAPQGEIGHAWPHWSSLGVTLLTGVLLWIVLIAPDHVELLVPDAFLPISLTWIGVTALACVLPRRVRRAAGMVAGFLIALVLLLKLADMGFYAVFDRPVDLVTDAYYFMPGLGVLVDNVGRPVAYMALGAAALAIVATLVLLPWITARWMRGVAALPRGWAVRGIGAVATLWLVCAAADISTPTLHWRMASTVSLDVAQARLASIPAGIVDSRRFAHAIRDDPWARVPAAQLLSALRGRDVLLVFVESYGRAAVTGSSFSAGVDRVLQAAARDLAARGYHLRSAFMTSPTFGGGSWLAHATLESGLWVDSQHRYDQLLTSRRMTLASAFKRAGWRTVLVAPADTKPWPAGRAFYGFDAIHDRTNLGYHGPRFSYATMPDQFTYAALQRSELGKSSRLPVFAEIDTVSSHNPWMPLPHMVPWSALGDGSIFDPQPAAGLSPDVGWNDAATVRRMYGKSVEYSLTALFSFLTTYPDPRRVVIMLGDHQPWQVVSGAHSGHEVPVAIITQDAAVTARVADWHWQSGLLPDADAPVWQMSAFRDRFLTAFSPDATTASAVPRNSDR